MSRWRPEWTALGLDRCALVAAVAYGGFETLALRDEAHEPTWTEAALLAAVRVHVEQQAGSAGLHFVVAPELCKHWTQQPPAGLKSLQELRQIAAARCAKLFGGGAADWRLVADWDLGQAFACAALPAPLLDVLQAVAHELRRPLRVDSAVLLALSRLAPEFDRPGWLAWHTPSSIVLARGNGRRVVALRCVRHAEGNDSAALRERMRLELMQEQLSIGGDAGSTLDEPVWMADWPGRPGDAGHPAPQAMPAAAPPAVRVNDASWACAIAVAVRVNGVT